MDWFIVDSMRNLAKNGYEITLICNMDEAFIKRNSDYARCIPLPMSRGVNPLNLVKSISRLKKIFKKEKFDVIYYTSPNASMYASVAGRLAGIKRRVYSQCGLRYVSFSGIKRRIFKFIEKLTCRFSTHIRAQSPLNMQFAIDDKLCKKEKISVVGIGGTTGVDLSLCDAFDREAERLALREKYGIPSDAFLYGYVGRVNADKGINELIEAFETVSAKNESVWLALVGMIDDTNPIKQEIMERAKNHGRIVFVGNVPPSEVYKHMAMFDVLTHPTYREGFGKVLQEAMGMRLPIITTDVPGPSEVVDGGEYGVLVKVRDKDDLAEKMEIMCNNPDLRKSLSVKGRERAEKYFDRPIMLNNILRDMDDIVQKKM
jgi:glycosyltransferase involved in cell wall biosynthesis